MLCRKAANILLTECMLAEDKLSKQSAINLYKYMFENLSCLILTILYLSVTGKAQLIVVNIWWLTLL
jgi:hypothetical protein